MAMAQFNAKLVKWGNSLGVAIPKPIVWGLELKAGDTVVMVDKEDGSVVIKKKTD